MHQQIPGKTGTPASKPAAPPMGTEPPVTTSFQGRDFGPAFRGGTTQRPAFGFGGDFVAPEGDKSEGGGTEKKSFLQFFPRKAAALLLRRSFAVRCTGWMAAGQ